MPEGGEQPEAVSMVQRRRLYLVGSDGQEQHPRSGVLAAKTGSHDAESVGESAGHFGDHVADGGSQQQRTAHSARVRGPSLFATSQCDAQQKRATRGTWATRLDVLHAFTWQLPAPAEGVPEFVYWLAGAYRCLPAVIAYGLLVFLGGSGTAQLVATLSYWLVVQPGAQAAEAVWQFALGCPRPQPGNAGGLPASCATAAHFYWTWAMLEVVTRRRPVWQRLAAVAALAALLLPVPLAQAVLRERSPEQVVCGSLLGCALGIGFFLTLRLTGLWSVLPFWETAPKYGMLRHWTEVRDNLTTFWSGSVWPEPPWSKPPTAKQLAHVFHGLEPVAY